MKEVQRYTRGTGLRKTAMGVYPVAEALKEAIKLPTVYQLLAHLPRHTVPAAPSGTKERSRSPPVSSPKGKVASKEKEGDTVVTEEEQQGRKGKRKKLGSKSANKRRKGGISEEEEDGEEKEDHDLK